jgi:hypothetical protein
VAVLLAALALDIVTRVTALSMPALATIALLAPVAAPLRVRPAPLAPLLTALPLFLVRLAVSPLRLSAALPLAAPGRGGLPRGHRGDYPTDQALQRIPPIGALRQSGHKRIKLIGIHEAHPPWAISTGARSGS